MDDLEALGYEAFGPGDQPDYGNSQVKAELDAAKADKERPDAVHKAVKVGGKWYLVGKLKSDFKTGDGAK